MSSTCLRLTYFLLTRNSQCEGKNSSSEGRHAGPLQRSFGLTIPCQRHRPNSSLGGEFKEQGRRKSIPYHAAAGFMGKRCKLLKNWNEYRGTPELRGSARLALQENPSAGKQSKTGGIVETGEVSRSEGRSFRNFDLRTSDRAFLACLALHAPRSVSLVGCFNIPCYCQFAARIP